MDIDMDTMSATKPTTDEGGDSLTYFLLSAQPVAGHESRWVRFVNQTLKRVPERECNGHWHILSTDDKQKEVDLDMNSTTDSLMIADLNTLRNFVLHRAIAPKLLDYRQRVAFKHSIKICIHGETSGEREYVMTFWNGTDIGQTLAFQMKYKSTDNSDHSDGQPVIHHFIHCQTAPDQIQWKWYDNNSAMYKEYTMGPAVNAQLEASFQANLHFPASIGRFSNVNFNTFKEAIIPTLDAREAMYKRRRHFLLRFRFLEDVHDEVDEKNINDHHQIQRKIGSVEQIAVHPRPYCTFPRIVRRIYKNAHSVSEGIDDHGMVQLSVKEMHRRLRMTPQHEF